MPKPTLSLTDTLKSEAELREQYKDSSNLSARSSIYRFGTSKICWPLWVFDQMLAEFPAAGNVLEVGSGPGGIWKRNLDRVPQSWRVTLSDLSPGMMAEARAALGEDARFTFATMDVQQLALPDASVDGVVANHMLYHVADLPRGLRETRRVLRQGAKLIAGTNSENHMRRMKELLAEYMGAASPLAGGMPFSLDNGEAILRRVFDRVERRSIPGELRVTDPEAVVSYVMSAGGAPKIITGEKLAALRGEVAEEIARVGAWITPTESGVFIAS